MDNIGFLGAGFVGGTAFEVLNKVKGFECKIHDINPDKSKNSLQEVADCSVIFVALPTPMMDDGGCYVGFLEKAVSDLRRLNVDSLLVLKSTIPPGTTERLNFTFGNICFSPEFLTEANAAKDFASLSYQIIGYCSGDDIEKTNSEILQKLFREAYLQDVMNCKDIVSVHARAAEMCKYVRNCYLATRLSYFNEINQICSALEIDYETVRILAGMDERVGDFYNFIDKEEPEFSGSCLPKDINSLIAIAEQLGIDPKVLKAAWKKNLEIAKKSTWKELKNRAVYDEQK